MKAFWQRIGFAGRLTTVMVTLILVSILVLTSLVFVEYRSSQNKAVVNSLQSTSEMNVQAFTDWLLSRQDEIRFLAKTSAAAERDLQAVNALMQQLADAHGFYDTIFLVSPALQVSVMPMAGPALCQSRKPTILMSPTEPGLNRRSVAKMPFLNL